MISTEFKQNVELGDLITVRSALVDYLIIDPTFKKFDEALEYACANMNILQDFDNEPLEESERWDRTYLNQQKVALMVNFSKERIEHVKRIIDKVMMENVAQKTDMVSSQTSVRESNHKRTGKKVIAENVVDAEDSNSVHNEIFLYENQKSNSACGVSRNSERSTTGKTGKRIISEMPLDSQCYEAKNKTEDGIGTAMVVGGVAVAAVGLAVVKPVIIGGGVVLASAGVGLKVKSRR